MKGRFAGAVLALFAAPALHAQDIRFGGPLAGLVFDPPSRSLRPVLGQPGAARMLDPVLGADWATVAPNGRLAVIVRDGRVEAVLSGDDVQAPSGLPLRGAEVLDTPQLAAWAADSSSVLLYSASARAVQWLRIARAEVFADAPFPAVEGTVTAIAADPASRAAVLAVAEQGIYRAASGGNSFTLIYPGADISALALDPAGQALWAADRAEAKVVRISGWADSPVAGVAAADPDRLSAVSALGFSSSAKRLYAADSKTRRLYVFDVEAGSLVEGPGLDAVATSLLPFGRPSTLLLTQRKQPGDPLYIFDESSGGSVFFIPAAGGGSAQ